MNFRVFTIFYPRKLRNNYKKLLDYANVKTEAGRFLGFILVFGIAVALMLAFWLGYLAHYNIWIVFGISFVSFQLLIYMWLLLSVDAKAKFVEKMLPDALQLMASNMRSGITSDKALLMAARPEFGPLSE